MFLNFYFGTTFDVEAPAGQSPIKLGTLSPVASHDFALSLVFLALHRPASEARNGSVVASGVMKYAQSRVVCGSEILRLIRLNAIRAVGVNTANQICILLILGKFPPCLSVMRQITALVIAAAIQIIMTMPT